MYKVILLTADREPVLGCLKVLLEAEKKGFISLSAVVSDKYLRKKVEQMFNRRIMFISDRGKNEDKILQVIKKSEINLLISIQYKWIISEKIINAVDGYAFNIHFGKLPGYRGHHIQVHLILEGRRSMTTTLHWMAPDVDRGYIAFENTYLISKNDTSWSLMQKATTGSISLFGKLMKNLERKTQIPRIPIRGNGRFYSINSIFPLKKITSMDDFAEVDRKARAFYFPPHEPAYYKLNGRKYYVIPKAVYCK